jgi:MFS family permease
MTKTKFAILSISILTILLNGAIGQLFSILSDQLPGATPEALKLTLSISSIFCVISSLLTGYLDRYLPKKTLLAAGLMLFAAGGLGGGLVNTMNGLLVTRAVIGIGAGICLPLATAFIADFYEGEEVKETIGYSLFAASFSNMVFPLIGTWLAELNWRLGFLIYGISLPILVLTMLWIPNVPKTKTSTSQRKQLFYFSAPVMWATFLYFFSMVFFVSLPNNVSVFIKQESLGRPSIAAWINALSVLVSMFFSLKFAAIYRRIEMWTLPIGLFSLGLGFALISVFPQLWAVTLGHVFILGFLGLLHPLFPFMATRDTPQESSTSALAMVSSGFRMGTFVSPFFFMAANPLAGITTIRGEFMLSGLIFGAAALIAVIVFARKKRAVSV